MSSKFKVVGGCEVAGVQPGGTVTADELGKAGANIPALVAAGHLEETRSQPASSTSRSASATSSGDS